MNENVLPYIYFYIGSFLLGFFGLSQLIVLKTLGQKIPYMILVFIGYPALIGGLIWWMRQQALKEKKQEPHNEKEEYRQEELEKQVLETFQSHAAAEDEEREKEEVGQRYVQLGLFPEFDRELQEEEEEFQQLELSSESQE